MVVPVDTWTWKTQLLSRSAGDAYLYSNFLCQRPTLGRPTLKKSRYQRIRQFYAWIGRANLNPKRGRHCKLNYGTHYSRTQAKEVGNRSRERQNYGKNLPGETMQSYRAIKKNKLIAASATGIDPYMKLQNKINETKTDILFYCFVVKCKTQLNELEYKREIDLFTLTYSSTKRKGGGKN